jgi:hypothetical protein
MIEVTNPGLYERLVAEDLNRLLNLLEVDQITLVRLDTADFYIAIAAHICEPNS